MSTNTTLPIDVMHVDNSTTNPNEQPYVRKRGAEDTTENLTDQTASFETSDSKPDKYRAVAGPNQEEIDRERSIRKKVEERLAALESQYKNDLLEKEHLLDLTRQQAVGLQALQAKMVEMQEDSERVEVDFELQQDRISRLDASYEQAMKDKEDAIETKEKAVKAWHNLKESSAQILEEAKRAAERLQTQEAHIETLNREGKAQEEIIHTMNEQMKAYHETLQKLRAERDEVLRDKEELEVELQRSLRNAKDSLRSRKSSQQQPHEDLDMEADDERDPAPSGSTSASATPDIAAIVKQALAEYAAAQAPQTSNSTRNKRKNQSPKSGSRAHDRQIKKAAVDSLDPETESIWRSHLRRSFYSFTQKSSFKEFSSYSPVNEVVAENFAKANGPGPTENNLYRLYLGDGWRHAPWNIAVINNMVQPMLDDARANHLEPMLSPEVVKAFLWDFILQVRNVWKARKPRVHTAGERLETHEEAQTRANGYEAFRAQAVRSTTRKRVKRNDRMKGVKMLLDDPSLSVKDKKRWQMMANVLKELDVEGQSSDNTDYEGNSDSDQSPALLTTVPVYRRRILSELMAELDQAIKEATRKALRQSGQRYVPKPTRIRRRTSIISENTVKRSLPRSCYHRRYLDSLTPDVYTMVQPRNDAIPIFDQFAAKQAESDSMEEDI